MDRRIIVIIAILLLFLGNAFAILDSGSTKIFAVTDDEVGMAADLTLYTIPGSGEVSFITSNSLVGKDTQTTGNIALDIAREKTGEAADQHTFIFDIRANASEVEGPSAGAAMTLLAYSLLSERPLSGQVGITGTINSDGSVGVVGGVYPKAKVASEMGLKLFMIPKGEARQVMRDGDRVESINLLTYGPEELGMKIVEVSMIDEVIEYAYSDIDAIQVDITASPTGFIPDAIEYKPVLSPMKEMASTYVERANGMIEEAWKGLEVTTLDEGIRSDYYPLLNSQERKSEMASIYLDQNFLYSSANEAFNARILAGTINEIADNPSLLSKSSRILDNKISSLKGEIKILKGSIDYIAGDKIEWIIGAQQRVAYAENALQGLEETRGDLDELEGQELEDALFLRVYDYVSAESWLDAAKDFMEEAKKSTAKKIPQYSGSFISRVENNITSAEGKISDANVSEGALSEAVRRLNAAKISFDNNFYFAALYDAYFAGAHIESEAARKGFSDEEILSIVESDIPVKRKELDSVWASLFIDHAFFYLETARFEEELGRSITSRASLNSAFDLIIIAENIDMAKEEVELYMASNTFQEYVEKPGFDTSISISYTKGQDVLQIVAVVLVIAVLVFVAVILLFGLRMAPSTDRGTMGTRMTKVERVRHNLDKALAEKKVTEAEYFFMKKRYDDELKSLKSRMAERSKAVLNLDETKAKIKALEKGRKALKKHYKTGIILEEDYKKHYVELTREVAELKGDVHMYEAELRSVRAHRRPEGRGPGKKKEKKRRKKRMKKKDEEVKGSPTPSDDVKGTGGRDSEVKGTERKGLRRKKRKKKK